MPSAVWAKLAVGWLIPIVLLLAVALSLVMQSVPAYGGYTWIFPVWALRGVVLRSWFPTAAVVAWLLGVWSDPGRRQELVDAIRWVVSADATAPRWRRQAGLIAIGGLATIAAWVLSPAYQPSDLAAYALAAVWLAHRQRAPGEARAALIDLVRVVVVLAAVSYVFTTVKACLFLVRSPADAAIVGFETGIFGEPPHRWVARAVASRPGVVNAFEEIYFRLFDHMAVGSLFLLGAGRHQERDRLWISLAACYLLGGFAYFILAGYGPGFFEPELYSYLGQGAPVTRETQNALLANTQAMRGDRPFVLPTYAFIACMPSLHLAHELVLLYYARSSRLFLLLTGLFVAATWMATLGLGWHYSVDVLGGLLLAAVSVAAAERWGRCLFPHAPRQTAIPGLRDLTAGAWRVLAIGMVVLLAHGSTLFNSFVLDDLSLALSARLRGLEDLPAVLTTGIYNLSGEPRLVAAFRPLSGLLAWVSWQAFRQSPGSQHLMNLVLLVCSLVALGRLLRQLGVSTRVALGLLLVIALHPLTSEVAAYVSARDLALAWATWLAIHGAARARTGGSTGWRSTALATAVAGLAHESFLLIGFSAALFATASKDSRERARPLPVVVGHLVGAGIALVLRTVGAPEAWRGGNVLEMLWPVTRRALAAVLTPVDLSPLVTMTPGSPAGGAAVALGVAALLGVALRVGRKTEWARSGALGAAVAGGVLAGQAYEASVAGVAADRGAFGLLIAAALGGAPAIELVAARLAEGLDRRRLALLWAGVLAIGLVMLPFTMSAGITYRNDGALARLLITTHPDDPASQARTGLMLAYAGELAASEVFCTRAARSPAAASDTDLCAAVLAAQRGHLDEALARITRYLEQRPGRALARQLLWHLLITQGRRDEVRAWVVRLGTKIGDEPDIIKARRYLTRTRQAVNPLLLPPRE